VGDGKYFASFIRSLRWIGYACVLMACSASPKPIGTVRIHTVRIRYGTVAPPEFAAFAAFSFVRAFTYSATLYAFFCVPGTAPYLWGELCGRMMADAMGPGLCQAKPPSHATQPLRFGIGFIVALVLPLNNAQWLVYKMELPTCLRQACMYAWSRGGVVGVCSCVPLGSRRRGSWLPYICISSCHFLVSFGVLVQAIPPQ
jgi:hypothetical protein